MVRLNSEEKEQINKLSYFWRDYGKYIIGIIIVAIIAYSSSIMWQSKIREQSLQASLLYSKIVEAMSKNNITDTYEIASKMQKQYPQIEYTTFANLISAKVAFTHKELDKSAMYLNLVIKDSKDKYLVDIAKLRLVDVYLDQNKTKEAIDFMNSSVSKISPDLMPLYHEKMGDIYFVINDKVKARNSYKTALALASGSPELTQALQIKLDALGN